MLTIKHSQLALLTCVLASGTLSFGSTFTSCSVEPTGVGPGSTITNPTSCALSGGPNSPGPDFGQYSLNATASTSASGGATGSISAISSLNLTYLADPGNLQGYKLTDSLYAEAQLTADFTSAGPVREGYISFGSAPHGPFTDTDLYSEFSDQFSGFTLTQENFTYNYDCVTTDSNICIDPTVPIELGTPFTLSVSDSASQTLPPRMLEGYTNYVYTGIPDIVTFTLTDQSGSAVNSLLVPATTGVPEPATYASAGISLLLLLAAGLTHKYRRN